MAQGGGLLEHAQHPSEAQHHAVPVQFSQVRHCRTPWFNGWGFNLPRGQSLLDKWNLIPEGIDILMTHGPPLGFRDWVPKELQRVGCVELLNTVQRRVRPKLHVFGGIHEGYGIMTDGYTTYINASTCTVSFQPTNPPIIFDLPNPQGS
ncbi:Metallophosphoesterase MPPED2 [Tupaia chinensis]|uniref:Metallophosphoesterase MPPED2 n=1 Tax=Tupaia chinensis TaxID=246437 RepID=L9LBB9_TUPCH|nr:Metallophosphoesterase MPPED2 [Tupaia chinensis]